MQQINLYLPELRPQREWLTANTVLFCVVGSLVLVGVLTVFGKQRVADLENNLVNLEAHKASAKSQIENIKSATKPLNLSLLDEQIRRLRDEISAREQIGKIIEYQNLGNAEGFSGALDSLAEHSISTIALKEISLLDGGRFLKMRGETYQPKDIATYISTLSEEPYFSDTQFGVLNVSNIKNNRRVHEFSLGFEAALSLANSGGGEFYGDVSK